MKLLEERIQTDGRVLGTEVLKVDNFLNFLFCNFLQMYLL